MKNIRWISAGLLASGVLLLSGCVAVPGGYGYDTGYDNGYYAQQPYYGYGEPAPVVVAPSVYLQGGSYYNHNRGYYDGRRRGYDGRPWNDGPDRGPRPGAGPRPSDGRPGVGPRPGPPPQVARPRIQSPEENVRRGFTPDGRQRE